MNSPVRQFLPDSSTTSCLHKEVLCKKVPIRGGVPSDMRPALPETTAGFPLASGWSAHHPCSTVRSLPPLHLPGEQVEGRCGLEQLRRELRKWRTDPCHRLSAPSCYRRHAVQQRKPQLRCARAKRDDELIAHIQRVWHANMQVYGADKVWMQMNREGVAVARCTV